MPIYEFVCRDCQTQFEHLQSFSAKGHPPCPNCQSMHVSRLLGKPAIHFKGSGWYVTDSKGSKQSANGGEGAGKESAGKESAGKEGAGKETSAVDSAGKPGEAAASAPASSAKEPSAAAAKE